jgi:hypothetical protein
MRGGVTTLDPLLCQCAEHPFFELVDLRIAQGSI